MSTDAYQLVTDLINQGRLEEAHALLTRAASEQKDNPEELLDFGRLALAMGKYDEAEKYLRLALALAQNSAEAHYQLGLVFLKQNRPKEAMPEFREACEGRKDFALGHLHWGLSLMQMGNIRGAIGQFKQAIKLAPKLVAAYYQAGLAYLNLGQYQEAIDDLKKATALEPNFAQAFNAQGMAFSAMGRDDLALESFAKASQLDENFLLAKCNWASALANLGNFEEAQLLYRQALAAADLSISYRERALIYNNAGVCHYLAGSVEQAADKILEACQIDASLQEAHINLGLLRTKLKEYELAQQAFENALKGGSPTPELSMYLGVIALLKGDYVQALDQFAIAQNGALMKPELDVWMGYAHLALGRAQTAQLHFVKACQEQSISHLGFDGVGCCLIFLGDLEQAAESFRQALLKEPKFALAHLHLARSLEASGQIESSRQEYDRALHIDADCLLPEKEIIEILLNNLDFDGALNRCLKILEIKPNDPEATLSLIRTLKSQERFDQALNLAKSMIIASPECGRARNQAGQILMSLGRLSEADEMFASASHLEDVEASLYFAWGKTLALLGFFELALKKYEQAWEIDPYDENIYELWGETLKALGRFSEAKDVFKRASDYLYK